VSSYKFTSIAVPFGGNLGSSPHIDNAGDIVGTYRASNGHSHGFLFSKGTYTSFDIGISGVTDTFINGISSDGTFIGGSYLLATGVHGYVTNPPNYVAVPFNAIGYMDGPQGH